MPQAAQARGWSAGLETSPPSWPVPSSTQGGKDTLFLAEAGDPTGDFVSGIRVLRGQRKTSWGDNEDKVGSGSGLARS